MLTTALAIQNETAIALPALIDRAMKTLAGARNAAEILEARDMASVVYDAAKKAARLAKAKGAYDDLIKTSYRTQADALDIEAQAKRRLADEYDAAQDRGEVVGPNDGQHIAVPNGNGKATAADVGLSRKEIHEARIVRDAEKTDPGIVRRTVDAAITAGEEPTKAKVRRAVLETVRPQSAARPSDRKAAICDRVREAVLILSGLPPAHEVVGFFANNDGAILISEHLRPATAWLADFSDAWKDDQC